MIGILRDLYPIMRANGRRKLVFVLGLAVAQAVIQTIAVFSLIPLLTAAADMARFRQSRVGSGFVDLIGGGSDQRVLIWAGMLSLAILIVGNLSALGVEYLRAQYAQRIAHALRSRLLRALLARRYEYFTGVNSSMLMKNLVENPGAVASYLVTPALDVLARALLTIFLIALVVAVEPLIVIAGTVIMALYYLLVMLPVRRRAERSSEVLREDVSAVYFQVSQLLTGIKPIIASGSTAAFASRVERASLRVVAEMPKIPMYSSIPRSGLELIVFGGMIAWLLIVLATGGSLASLLPRIGLVAVVAYRLMPSLQVLVAQSGAMAATRQALVELLDLFAEQERFAAGPAMASDGTIAVQPLEWSHEIRFENVGFTYAGAGEAAIAGVSFTIPKGSRVAFVGPTGSGKSTLIDLLLGLLEPTTGRILVDGAALDHAAMPEWRRAVGYVPQELFLLDGSIAENIAFGVDADSLDRQRVEAVADIAQAREFIEDGRSHGFDALVGERGVRLSGGQRQRLALARALYGRPNVLVLDEATSALDPATERKVVQALADGHDRLTVVTVTHRLGTVRDYDCIHYVEQGRIVASGDFASLAKFHDTFASINH